MAFVRLLKDLMREKKFAPYVVPIIPDEARTFGLDAFFPTFKIYNPHGQKYTPVDHNLMLSYREATNGLIWHTGINEAGSAAAFNAVSTSYATHGVPMIPIYIFYSMFGFQRTGDQFWATADQLGRGFLLGATAGRTTLTGEGTQHMDGHSPILASTNPGVIHYDPAYGYEVAHIFEHGLKEMYVDEKNIIYYITVYNEPINQPEEPDNVDVDGIRRGMYLLKEGENGDGRPRAQLLASGVGVPWALKAQELLANDWGVVADVWSVTSWERLRRDAMECDKEYFMNPGSQRRTPYVTERLQGRPGPVVATSDYMKALQDSIREWVPEEYYTLGADGMGLSDMRPAARRHFRVDAECMVVKTLQALASRGEVSHEIVGEAFRKYQIDVIPQPIEPAEH